MKKLGIVFLLLGSLNGFGAEKYLGQARNMSECINMAVKAGYQKAILGGVVKGYYYSNACFGSTDTLSSSNWNVTSESVATRVGLFETALGTKEEYGTLATLVEKLQTAADALVKAAKDGLSQKSAFSLYRDVSLSYEELAHEYYAVHPKEEDSKVTTAWKDLVAQVEKLRTQFEPQ